MTDTDLRATNTQVQQLLEDRHVLYAKAVASGDPEQIKATKEAEHNAYWARRYVGREYKTRGLTSQIQYLRAADRLEAEKNIRANAPRAEIKDSKDAVPKSLSSDAPKEGTDGQPEPQGTQGEAPPKHPQAWEPPRTDYNMSPTERRQYSKNTLSLDASRAGHFSQFLRNRGLDPNFVNTAFRRAPGLFKGAKDVLNVAFLSTIYHLQPLYIGKQFGVTPEKYGVTPEEFTKTVEDVSRVVPSVIAWTKNYMHQMYGDNLVVHRGIRGPQASDVIAAHAATPDGESFEYGTNPVSIWTPDRKAAEFYAKPISSNEPGVIISTNVSPGRVVWSTEAVRRLQPGEVNEVMLGTGLNEIYDVSKDDVTILGQESAGDENEE